MKYAFVEFHASSRQFGSVSVDSAEAQRALSLSLFCESAPHKAHIETINVNNYRCVFFLSPMNHWLIV